MLPEIRLRSLHQRRRILAFEMLTALVVVVVEWDRHVKLGILGPVNAETLKCLEHKFAGVKLCAAATIDLVFI